jgi:protein ImuB
VVLAADRAAQAAGLRVGMPASKAQALVSGLIIRDAEPAADADGLERLALWVLRRYAPVVAADPPDGIVIDTTGADHLHGGEPAMIAAIVERLGVSGIAARAAIADTWGAAHALARYGARPVLIAAPGSSPAVMGKLPIASLRLSAEILGGLRVLGFDTVGELLAHPAPPAQ